MFSDCVGGTFLGLQSQNSTHLVLKMADNYGGLADSPLTALLQFVVELVHFVLISFFSRPSLTHLCPFLTSISLSESHSAFERETKNG